MATATAASSTAKPPIVHCPVCLMPHEMRTLVEYCQLCEIFFWADGTYMEWPMGYGGMVCSRSMAEWLNKEEEKRHEGKSL